MDESKRKNRPVTVLNLFTGKLPPKLNKLIKVQKNFDYILTYLESILHQISPKLDKFQV